MKTPWLGQPLQHFETLPSTNEAALEWARDGAPHGAVVTANVQTAGRGRRGRTWSSPPDKGMYLSMILRPSLALEQVPRLTILAALAAARAVRERTGLPAATKWPNDVLVRGRKLGGILCETQFKDGHTEYAIIGIGLNVNFEAGDFPPRLIFPATSLLLETQQRWLVSDIKHALLHEFEAIYDQYGAGGWEELRSAYVKSCAVVGEAVTVVEAQDSYAGVVADIDGDGILIVNTADGPRRVVAGDVRFDG